MTDYILQLNGSIEPQWELRFTQPSDAMAIEYAERLAGASKVVHASHRMSLFNVTEDKAIGHWEIRARTQLIILSNHDLRTR